MKQFLVTARDVDVNLSCFSGLNCKVNTSLSYCSFRLTYCSCNVTKWREMILSFLQSHRSILILKGGVWPPLSLEVSASVSPIWVLLEKLLHLSCYINLMIILESGDSCVFIRISNYSYMTCMLWPVSEIKISSCASLSLFPSSPRCACLFGDW